MPGPHHFTLAGTRLLRICPTCANFQNKAYDLTHEPAVLAEPCPNCGFVFLVVPETANSTAVFKDLADATS